MTRTQAVSKDSIGCARYNSPSIRLGTALSSSVEPAQNKAKLRKCAKALLSGESSTQSPPVLNFPAQAFR